MATALKRPSHAVFETCLAVYRYDQQRAALVLSTGSRPATLLHPAFVRRNDTSAATINEWTGERVAPGGDVAEGIAPTGIQAVGNYAVLIMWEDGFNQASGCSSCPAMSPPCSPVQSANWLRADQSFISTCLSFMIACRSLHSSFWRAW